MLRRILSGLAYNLHILLVHPNKARGRKYRAGRLMAKGYGERQAWEMVYARDLFRHYAITEDEVSFLLQMKLLDSQKIRQLEKYELIRR